MQTSLYVSYIGNIVPSLEIKSGNARITETLFSKEEQIEVVLTLLRAARDIFNNHYSPEATKIQEAIDFIQS